MFWAFWQNFFISLLITKLCNYLVTLGLHNQLKDWLAGFLRILAELFSFNYQLCNYLVTLGLLNQQKDWLVGFLRILAELFWLAADFFLLLASAKLSLGWAG